MQQWKLVPIPPTIEMLLAGRKAIHDSHNVTKKASMVFEAMVAEAPAPRIDSTPHALPEHWLSIELRSADPILQKAARCYAEEYAEVALEAAKKL